MLKPVLYIDSYAVLNLLMDYFLLLAAGWVTRAGIHRLRLFFSALLGSVYSVAAVFFPHEPLLALLAGLMMVLIAFGPRRLLRRTITFLVLSCALAGVLSLLSTKVLLHLPVLLLSASCFALLLRRGFSGTAGGSKTVLPALLTLGDRRAEFSVLVDTGNCLLDPMTGQRVLVSEWESVRSLFPRELSGLLSKENFSSPENTLILLNELFPGRFMLLPFSSLGQSKGLLLAFRADLLCLEGREEIRGISVAITPEKLGKNDDFTALIGALE